MFVTIELSFSIAQLPTNLIRIVTQLSLSNFEERRNVSNSRETIFGENKGTKYTRYQGRTLGNEAVGKIKFCQFPVDFLIVRRSPIGHDRMVSVVEHEEGAR